MKAFISVIGSRGDVQPVLALAVELKALGHDAVLCASTEFRGWVESHGVRCLGLEATHGVSNQQIAEDATRVQFESALEGAKDCDVVVASGPIPLAGRTVAKHFEIPYVYATPCPALVCNVGGDGDMVKYLNRQNWALVHQAINDERLALGLGELADVRGHAFTDEPWIAADPALTGDACAVGTWFLHDHDSLSMPLERFLDAGTPPIYVGLGSTMMGNAEETTRALVAACREAGYRVVTQQRRSMNLERLFPRCAAIIHHGGAGTTVAATRAGRPQIIVPHCFDQFYWARRLCELGIGIEYSPLGDDLAGVIREALDLTPAAQAFAGRVELRGAALAAERLAELI